MSDINVVKLLEKLELLAKDREYLCLASDATTIRTAIKYIQDVQPRVLSLDELKALINKRDSVVYIETIRQETLIVIPGIVHKTVGDGVQITDGLCCDYLIEKDNYNRDIRCWSKMPSWEQVINEPKLSLLYSAEMDGDNVG